MKKKHNYPPSKSRAVHYSFCSLRTNPSKRYCDDEDFAFDVEERLAKAKSDGIITNYDDGRNRCPWFEGPPGKAIRALKLEFDNKYRRSKTS